MRRLLTALALLVASSTAPAFAGKYVDVEIIDRDTGRIATPHAYRGQHWIAGTPGHRYAVRLRNLTGERVLAVLSVDGVNAVSGETASPQQTGYVLGPWQTTEVTGWRKSLSDIATFEFTELADSYAARTGRPDNVGVIGVAVFRERRPTHQPWESVISRPKSDAPAPAAAERDAGSARAEAKRGIAGAPAPQESLGTGHGAREWSQARQVAFERDSRNPVEVLSLRYDSERNLVALGVLPRPPRPQYPRNAPDPFPIGFVPDPPRWR